MFAKGLKMWHLFHILQTEKSAATRTLRYIPIGEHLCPKEIIYQETLAGEEELEYL